MSIYLIVLLCSVAVAFPQSGDVSKYSPVEQPIKNGIDIFTQKFIQTMYKRASPNSNVLFSPINVYNVLSMLMLGTDGDSRRELASVLNFPSEDDETFLRAHKNLGELLKSLQITKSEPCLSSGNTVNCTIEDVSLANGIFLNKPYAVLPSYAKELKSFYNGTIENVDFRNQPKEATDQINKWVSEKTRQLINKLFEDTLSDDTRMLLAASVHFSANWEQSTFKKALIKKKFMVKANEEVHVEYMHNSGGQVLHYDNHQSSFSAISLPYKGQDYATLFVLPKEENSIDTLSQTFSMEDLQTILREARHQFVDYRIPRTNIEWSNDLVEPLKSLNLTNIFVNVDLSKMISKLSESLSVSQVKHATTMKMDQHGTVATAVTAVNVEVTSINPIAQTKFHVNKPYLLFIYHKQSSIVLFSALIRNPSSH